MARRAALSCLALGSPFALVVLLVGGSAGEAIFAALVIGFPVALITLAVAQPRGLGALAWPLALFLALQELSAAALFLLRGRVLDAPWVGGFPAAAAFQLYGLCAIPLLLVTLTYAFTFDRFGLSREDLEQLQRLRDESGSDA